MEENIPVGTSPEGDAASGDASSAPDPITNVKAEFNRKLDNVTAELKRTQEAILSQLQAKAAPAAQPEVDLSDLMYKDPVKYAEIVEERAEKRIMSKLDQRTAQQTKQNTVLNSLVQEFPELSDQNSPLFKKAVENYNTLSDDERSSPMAYKLAVKDAAMDLDIKPRSKRQSSDNEGYLMGGPGSGGSNSRPARTGDLDPIMTAFAEHLGLPINDPKRKESLKKRAQRKNWNNWE